MKRIKKYSGAILLLLAVLLAGGCIKDDAPAAVKGTNVTLRVSRAGEGQLPISADEVVKTLRIIAVQNGKVVFNRTVGVDQPLPDDGSEYQIVKTLRDIMPVHTRFYVIANEASLGLDNSDYLKEGATVGNDNIFPELITESGLFPKAAAGDNGIPALGEGEVTINPDRDNSIEIELTYAVAKIVFDFDNQTGQDIAINAVNYGAFFANQSYFYPGTATVPAGTTYTTWSFPTPFTIPAGETTTPVHGGYFFATAAGNAAFTLSLTPANTAAFGFLQTSVPFLANDPSRDEIHRGEAVRIKATITGSELIFGNVTVTPWSENNIELE